MLKKSRKTAIVMAAAMALSFSSCGKADPNDYVYGESISQLAGKDIFIAGNDNDWMDENDPDLGYNDDFQPVEYSDTENKEFEDYLMDMFKEDVTGDTLSYNYTVLDGSHYGIEAPNPATLGDADMSQEAIDKDIKETKEEYEKLMKFEGQSMTEEEYMTWLCLKSDFELTMYQNDNYYFYEPFSPMRGFQENIGTNFTEYRFDDKQDVEDYIQLMTELPEYTDHIIEYENERVKKGYAMQDATCDEVIEQCDNYLEKPEENFLIPEFNNKIDELDFLTDKEKEEYKAKNKEAVLNGMIPCMQKIKDCVTAMKGKATITGGLCQYEGGKDYYENYIIPYYSGTRMPAEKIIKLMEEWGDANVMAMTRTYMASPEAYNYFATNLEKLFEEADSREATENIDILMKDCMDEYPEIGTIPYRTDYLSEVMSNVQDSTLAYYISPAIDDEEHNIIKVNGNNREDLWVTLAHEGCPGHMYQNAYFQSTNPNPIRATANYLGYQEGWAVYSSYRMMNYYDFKDTEDDAAVAKLCRINKELGYMLYGRIDLGVNYEGWTKEDIASYMSEMGYNGEYAEELMNTVVGDPGVYLSYSFSQLMMERMRKKVENAMGDKFDPVEYHKVLLETGPCMFEDLEFKLDEYIYENK